MKATRFLIPSLLAVACLAGNARIARADQARAQVMVVGVAHLVAKNDLHNSAFSDDPLGPQRQAQIADVIARLARFAPTKVLIEADATSPVYDQRYKAYRAGRFELGANEIYQFGFRLAAAANNSAIYPIDAEGPTIIDDKTPVGRKMIDFLVAASKADRGQSPPFDGFLDRQAAIERTGTYLDLLQYLNTDAAIRANASSYSVLAGMGRDANSAGAAYVAQWYGRNCYIFANIVNVTSPGDRVVVFIGQGHSYLLREFVRLNPHLQDIDPLAYLK